MTTTYELIGEELAEFYALSELEFRRRAPDPSKVSFVDYVRAVKPRYVWYPHAARAARVLQRVADGEMSRVMMFEPPRHGKSERVSRLFTAYYLYRYPERFVGLGSYGAQLAGTLSRSARDNFRVGGGRIRRDADAVHHWETREGGMMWSCGVGGPATGKGWHLGVVDDPVKNHKEAASEVIQLSHLDWWDSTWMSREEPDSALVLIETRWNELDLAGRLLAREREGEAPECWHIVNFPAIKEEAEQEFPSTCTVEPDPREVGEPLCPERVPLARLRTIEVRTPYFWNALYQQRPTPREGGMFPLGALKIVGAAPARSRFVAIVRYWDKAGADEGKGDYTAGVLMGATAEGEYYVLDVVRFQKAAGKRNSLMRETAAADKERWGRGAIYIERPPGLGAESTAGAIRALAGYAVAADPVTANKVERAEPFAAQVQAGNVYVVSGAWTPAYCRELTAFPYATFDDQVDASSGAFNRLALDSTEVRRLSGLEDALKGKRK